MAVVWRRIRRDQVVTVEFVQSLFDNDRALEVSVESLAETVSDLATELEVLAVADLTELPALMSTVAAHGVDITALEAKAHPDAVGFYRYNSGTGDYHRISYAGDSTLLPGLLTPFGGGHRVDFLFPTAITGANYGVQVSCGGLISNDAQPCVAVIGTNGGATTHRDATGFDIIMRDVEASTSGAAKEFTVSIWKLGN